MSTPATRDIYSISRLNREVKTILEHGLPLLWIEGEISNFKAYGSGHWYFSLKDEAAQVSCAMFRGKNLLVKFRPKDGMQILVRARVTLYEPRGNYQVIVEHMEEAGEGALRRAFEELKNRLAAEGLFDSAHKLPLPAHPRRIGVITSASGAAVHDVLTTLQRRFNFDSIIVYPVPVQGKGAGKEIAAMIDKVAQRNEVDVLILARGGGSLEDLWAFNEEVVARAIHACHIPLVSGIGHEVDFTIADFVADQRAPTPTAAAELISPDRYQWLQRNRQLADRLNRRMQQLLQQQQQRVDWLVRRLPHPGARLKLIRLRIEEIQWRHQRGLQQRFSDHRYQLATLEARLQQHNPSRRLSQLETSRQHLQQRLQRAMQQQLVQQQQHLAHLVHSLDTVSPLETLKRGYAIVQDVAGKQVIRHHEQLKTGDQVITRLGTGRFLSTVDETYAE